MRIPAMICAVLMLGACATPITEYEPVVDLAQSDPAKYQQDLAECRQIAKAAQDRFREEQQRQAAAQIVAGVIVGAVAGAAIGSVSGNAGDGAGVGALYGAGAGAASSAGDDYQALKGQPQRIVDRCVARRGHVVLSDVGQGLGQY